MSDADKEGDCTCVGAGGIQDIFPSFNLFVNLELFFKRKKAAKNWNYFQR